MKRSINTGEFVLLLLGIVFNAILLPEYGIAQIFALYCVFIIYIKFNSDKLKVLYYVTIAFALEGVCLRFPVSGSVSIYYYAITLIGYLGIQIYRGIKQGKCSVSIIGKTLSIKYDRFLVIFVLYIASSYFIARDKFLFFKAAYNYLLSISLLIMMVIENKTFKGFKNTLAFLKYIFLRHTCSGNS